MSLAEPQVVIVEDHLALRKGIELLFRREGIRIVGATDDADEALAMIPRRRPDVAIVDIGLAGRSGIELTAELLKAMPELRVLIYTGAVDQPVLRAALGSGARGFALKTGPPAELVAAVRLVAEGGEWVDPRVAELLDARERESVSSLSDREREVLELIATGLTTDEAAAKLTLSPGTVDTHVRNVIRKLGARNRVHAVALMLRHSGAGVAG